MTDFISILVQPTVLPFLGQRLHVHLLPTSGLLWLCSAALWWTAALPIHGHSCCGWQLHTQCTARCVWNAHKGVHLGMHYGKPVCFISGFYHSGFYQARCLAANWPYHIYSAK